MKYFLFLITLITGTQAFSAPKNLEAIGDKFDAYQATAASLQATIQSEKAKLEQCTCGCLPEIKEQLRYSGSNSETATKIKKEDGLFFNDMAEAVFLMPQLMAQVYFPTADQGNLFLADSVNCQAVRTHPINFADISFNPKSYPENDPMWHQVRLYINGTETSEVDASITEKTVTAHDSNNLIAYVDPESIGAHFAYAILPVMMAQLDTKIKTISHMIQLSGSVDGLPEDLALYRNLFVSTHTFLAKGLHLCALYNEASSPSF